MGVMTIRFNEKEESILDILQKYFDDDKSKIIKEALFELYEEIRDREVIEDYEKRIKSKTVKYYSTEEVMKNIGKNTKKR